MKEIERSIGVAATKIAKDINANCIVSIEKNPKFDFNYNDQGRLEAKVAVFREVRKGVYSKNEYKHNITKPTGGSILPIKMLVAGAISRKFIKNKERVVCVVNENLFSVYKGLLFVFDVDKIFFDISQANLVEDISPDIIESIINICLELIEGREGRKIGSAFIIGDEESIKNHTKQMIINPFNGYDEKFRCITDPNIKETIKEFSQLDGVFILDKKGIVKSAGTYINIDTGNIEFQGLGTKHRSCAALTGEINCIAIVVSRSGGKITVFKEGKAVLRL